MPITREKAADDGRSDLVQTTDKASGAEDDRKTADVYTADDHDFKYLELCQDEERGLIVRFDLLLHDDAEGDAENDAENNVRDNDDGGMNDYKYLELYDDEARGTIVRFDILAHDDDDDDADSNDSDNDGNEDDGNEDDGNEDVGTDNNVRDGVDNADVNGSADTDDDSIDEDSDSDTVVATSHMGSDDTDNDSNCTMMSPTQRSISTVFSVTNGSHNGDKSDNNLVNIPNDNKGKTGDTGYVMRSSGDIDTKNDEGDLSCCHCFPLTVLRKKRQKIRPTVHVQQEEIRTSKSSTENTRDLEVQKDGNKIGWFSRRMRTLGLRQGKKPR